MPPDGLNWENLTSNAILGFTFVLIVRWMLGRFSADSTAIQKAIEVNTVTLLSLQQQLLAHDLTVTGINPSAGADLNERSEKALRKYEEVNRSIAELKQVVLRGCGGNQVGITEKLKEIVTG